MFKKRHIKFIRYGDLSSIKQSGYKKDTFHSAPVKKGFYAFVEFLVEPFLLGGYNLLGTKHSKRIYIKDEKGEKIIIGRTYEDKNKPSIDEYEDYFWMQIRLDDVEMNRIEKRFVKKQKTLFISEHHDEKTGYIYLETMKRPKVFEYKKELWHHLIDETPHNLVLSRSKDWILTDYKTYIDALNLALHNENSFQHEWNFDWKNGGIPPKRRLQFSRDKFEVFISGLN